MGRNLKQGEPTKVVGTRFTESFLSECPPDIKESEWIRDLAIKGKNNVNDNENDDEVTVITVNGIELDEEDNNTIVYFYSFLTRLVKSGRVGDLINEDDKAQSKRYGAIVKKILGGK